MFKLEAAHNLILKLNISLCFNQFFKLGLVTGVVWKFFEHSCHFKMENVDVVKIVNIYYELVILEQ